MAKSKVKFLCYNILEEGVVAITGYDAGYPKERLFDRSLGFYCLFSTVGAFVVSISSNSLPVDTLIIENHNLNGVACTWDWSDNGSSWTTVQSWTQSGSNQIVKSITAPVTHAYWRLSMGSHAFQATELFMGRALAVPVVWTDQPISTDVADVERLKTYGGVDHFIRIGPKRKQRSYTVFMDRVDYPVANFISDLEYLDDYSKPLYIIDHEEICFLVEFSNSPPNAKHLNEGLMEFGISVQEVKG